MMPQCKAEGLTLHYEVSLSNFAECADAPGVLTSPSPGIRWPIGSIAWRCVRVACPLEVARAEEHRLLQMDYVAKGTNAPLPLPTSILQS